ncbi:MAG: biotin/lipoyl-containing protein, partial [Bacteroidia bacterium]
LGQNPGGFPPELSKVILKNIPAYQGRPNEHLKPIDFETDFKSFQDKFGKDYQFTDFLSWCFYPKVFEDYALKREAYGELYHLPTPAFFFGMKQGEELIIELAPGKNILVRMINVVDEGDGKKTVFFRLNGQTRSIEVIDKHNQTAKHSNRKAKEGHEVGSPLQGRLSKILVKEGDSIQKNSPLFTVEAMKMESTVISPLSGTVKSIVLKEGSLIEQDDLIIEIQTL